MSEATVALPAPEIVQDDQTKSKDQHEAGYNVICWDDPVNLMDYVTHVFQQVFAWPKQKAEQHMLQVHNHGKSILTRETFEKEIGRAHV